MGHLGLYKGFTLLFYYGQILLFFLSASVEDDEEEKKPKKSEKQHCLKYPGCLMMFQLIMNDKPINTEAVEPSNSQKWQTCNFSL